MLRRVEERALLAHLRLDWLGLRHLVRLRRVEDEAWHSEWLRFSVGDEGGVVCGLEDVSVGLLLEESLAHHFWLTSRLDTVCRLERDVTKADEGAICGRIGLVSVGFEGVCEVFFSHSGAST